MTSGRRRGRAACGEAAKGAAPARQTPSHHPLKGERASERAIHAHRPWRWAGGPAPRVDDRAAAPPCPSLTSPSPPRARLRRSETDWLAAATRPAPTADAVATRGAADRRQAGLSMHIQQQAGSICRLGSVRIHHLIDLCRDAVAKSLAFVGSITGLDLVVWPVTVCVRTHSVSEFR